MPRGAAGRRGESPRNCEGCAKSPPLALCCRLELGGAAGSLMELSSACAPQREHRGVLGDPQLCPHLLPQLRAHDPECSSKTNTSIGREPSRYLNTAVGLPRSWPYRVLCPLLPPCPTEPPHDPSPPPLHPRGRCSCYPLCSHTECKALSSAVTPSTQPRGKIFPGSFCLCCIVYMIFI